jgi:hypothetical protein
MQRLSSPIKSVGKQRITGNGPMGTKRNAVGDLKSGGPKRAYPPKIPSSSSRKGTSPEASNTDVMLYSRPSISHPSCGFTATADLKLLEDVMHMILHRSNFN